MGVCSSGEPKTQPEMRRPKDMQSATTSDGWLEQKYKLSGKVLGRGGFAKVTMCTERESGKRYACKCIRKRTPGGRKVIHAKYLNDEVKILKRVGKGWCYNFVFHKITPDFVRTRIVRIH